MEKVTSEIFKLEFLVRNLGLIRSLYPETYVPRGTHNDHYCQENSIYAMKLLYKSTE